MVQQLLIGHAGPQKIAQPAREFVSRERDCSTRRHPTWETPGRIPQIGTIEEYRRNQDTGDCIAQRHRLSAGTPPPSLRHRRGPPPPGPPCSPPAISRPPPWSPAGDRLAPQTSPALPTESV